MKRPEFDVKANVKVVNTKSPLYGKRGTVTALLARDANALPHETWINVNVEKEKLRKWYEDGIELAWMVDVNVNADGEKTHVFFAAEDVETVQHKFVDIQAIRETDVDLGNGVVRQNNVGAFEVGDHIQISEKIDGANSSIAWCPEDNCLEIFSRTNLLNGADGLRGFKSFIETKVANKFDFSKYPRFVFFGEWCVRHHIVYASGWDNVWRLYDVWDKDANAYLPQSKVKELANEIGVEYIHVLYDGPFVSWEHCRSFMHKNTYGDFQEGVVVKNQDKLTFEKKLGPAYIKIVNDEFKESMVKAPRDKTIDPVVQREMDDAKALISSVVTEARVRKMILKFVDEGLVPSDIKPQNMGVIAKNLGKRMFEDLMKEEPEVMSNAGTYSGKFCASISIDIAKKIVLGG